MADPATARSSASPNDLATGRQKLLGHLAVLLFAMLIAGSFTLGDLAIEVTTANTVTAVRFFFACILMAGVIRLSSGRWPTRPVAVWRYGVLGGLMMIYFLLMFVALGYSGPVSTGAVFTLIPFMSAGFGLLLLGQTTRPVVLLGLLIAAAGAVWVIFSGDIAAILEFRIGQGEAIFFFGCAAHALYAPMIKKLNRGEPVLLFTYYTLLGGAAIILVIALPDLLATDWLNLPSIFWITVAYLSIFTTAGTFYLVQFASMRLPSSKVLSYGYLTPSFIILYEGLIGHGWVSLSIMAGALVTAAALVWVALAPDR